MKSNKMLQSIGHHYQQIIKNPQNYDSVFQVALIHYQHHQYEQALPHFTKTYEVNHKSSDSAQYIGNIYFYSNQYEKAINWYEISLKASPLNGSVYNSLGVIYKKLGKIHQAIHYFQKCIQINPKNSLAHYALANVNYDLQNLPTALNHYQCSIQSNPKYDAPYIGRGNIFKKQGKIVEASRQYLKALCLNPKNQVALANLRSLPINQDLNINIHFSQIQNISQNNFIKQEIPLSTAPLYVQAKTKPVIRKGQQKTVQYPTQSNVQVNHEINSIKEQFCNMISLITNQLKMSLQNNQYNITRNNEKYLSARDKNLLIQINQLKHGQQEQQIVRKWIQQVVNEVVSTSFNFYLNNQMTYNQARIFCCQKILTNIYFYVSKRHAQIKPSFMKKINKFIQQSLEYIKYKYPLNEQLEVPYKIQHFISSNKRDNTDSIQYDYFSHYPYEYLYRQQGIYNDIIMKMINNLINTSNTSYYSFKQTMTKLFENVFDPNWKKQQPVEENKKRKNSIDKSRNQSPQKQKSPQNQKHFHKKHSQLQMANQNSINLIKSTEPVNHDMAPGSLQNLQLDPSFFEKRKQMHQEKRKKREHRQKVQSYTSYVIKKKIPEFVKCYSEEEIRNINVLKIKDKSIFRILTKWSEQLWQKFDVSGYFLNKVNVLMQKDKKLFYLSPSHKSLLNKLIQAEKQQISTFIQKISRQCNMNMQYHLLTRWLQHQDELQNNTGIFSANVVQNLQYFTVSYLNRLIHGLLRVSKRFSSSVLGQTHPQLLLLTFRIKDLLRCRFKSKQEQSQKVLRHILEQAEVTVLRVKNRLNDNNNDIMINLFFEKMICQIQLAVQTNTSKFIQCSNNFNHFLYELQRSYFGPITEMSNIWQSQDKRMKYYKKVQEKRIENFKYTLNGCSHVFQKVVNEYRPFVCSTCNIIYYHYNFIVHHKRCIHCKEVYCGNCQLVTKSSIELKKHLKIEFIDRYFDASLPFPQLSYFLIKQCNSDQLGVYYIKYEKRSKSYLISIRNNKKDYLFKPILQLTEKNIKNLLRKYVIVEMPHNYQSIIFKNKIEQTLFSQYIKQCIAQQKDEVSLCDFILGDQRLKSILNEQLNRNEMNAGNCKVKKLIIDRINQIKIRKQYIDHIVSDFNNLQYLWVSNNQLDALPKMSNPQKMIMINLQKTELKDLQKHSQFDKLQKLQFLIINQSHLKEIPLALKNITNLVHLQVCGSNIKHINQSIFNHLGSSLVYLNLSHNQLQKLPESIKDIHTLQYLNVCNNCLLAFPNSIIFNLSLTYLNLSDNIIKIIPEKLDNLIKLEYLELSNCHLSAILTHFSRLTRLKKVNLSLNKLHNTNFLSNLKVSKELCLVHSFKQHLTYQSLMNNSNFSEISDCQRVAFNSYSIGEVLQRTQFIKIQQLVINQCNMIIFPDIKLCQSLKILDLASNLIQQILEQDLQGLNGLQQLILNQNPIKFITNNFEALEILRVFQLDSCGLKGSLDFRKLTKLNVLKVANNHLTDIPNHFFQSSPNIKVLDVRNNRVFENRQADQHVQIKIGDRIDLLTSLQQIYLGNCQLLNVPQNIGKCLNIKVLRLQHNLIAYIPKQLQNLQKLQVLVLNGNNIRHMKNIQIFTLSPNILSSYTIMNDIMVKYEGSYEDEQQAQALTTFANRFSEEINNQIMRKQKQTINKCGEVNIKDTSMIHNFLKIESEYSVIIDHLQKVDSLIKQKKFNQIYLKIIEQNLKIRAAQVERQQFSIINESKAAYSNYQTCIRSISINCSKDLMKNQSFQTDLQQKTRFLHALIINPQECDKIFYIFEKLDLIFIDQFVSILKNLIQSANNSMISLRYYPYLQQIILPIEITLETADDGQEQHQISQSLTEIAQKHPNYKIKSINDNNKSKIGSQYISIASQIYSKVISDPA